jgi:hypothetical protein
MLLYVPMSYKIGPYIRKAKIIRLFHDDNAPSEDNLYLSTYFDDKYDKLITRQEVCLYKQFILLEGLYRLLVLSLIL